MFNRPEPKLPAQHPDYIGPCGRAWRCDLDAILHKQQLKGRAPPRELNICGWLAFAPYSHPIWPCVAVNCISLRDVPGWPPAVIHLEGATHEVFVAACDPDHPLAVDESAKTLQPLNFAGQFICASDGEARDLVDQAVRDICDGTLNPDTDHRHAWFARFSRSNAKAGADMPDMIAVTPTGEVVVIGTGASNVGMLEQVAITAATLAADESKKQ